MTSTEIIERINALTTHTNECAAQTDSYAPDDAHDLNSASFRDLLIDLDTDNEHDAPDFDELRDLLESLFADEYARDCISHLALDYSLCPLHLIDFAICFDDDDPDCAQIRTIFPYSHDT